MNDRIAFFGLGAMGFGMASNLIKTGHQVSVTTHSNAVNVGRLVFAGAIECKSKIEAVESSDTIVLCLPNSNVVQSVLDEVWPALSSRHLVLDTGTSSVPATTRLAERLQSKSVMFVESPVAGGKAQAEAGELGAFVGGSDGAFTRVMPVLEAFCTSIQHFGPVGSGGRAKLISNYLVLSMVRSIIETFHAAKHLNVDWEMFYRIICQGSGNSGALGRIIGEIVDRGNYSGYVFSVENALKDLNYIQEMSEDSDLQSILNTSALDFFDQACSAGHGELKISELLRSDIQPSLAEIFARCEKGE